MIIAGMSLDYSKSSSDGFAAKLSFCSGVQMFGAFLRLF